MVCSPAGGADTVEPLADSGRCAFEVAPSDDFAQTVRISNSAAAAFMPAAAERDGSVLVVWQESTRPGTRVSYALVREGCVGPAHQIEDELANPRRPSVAATASGWVVAYEARDVPDPVVRAVEIDASGQVVSAPQTISEPGRVGSRVRVSAYGDDVVFAWTDVSAHWIARRGPVEELPPIRVGADLEAPGLINFPRVLVDASGRVYLAYRDGGPERTDFEIRLVVKEVGEDFGEPINLSQSSGLMSDDVTLVPAADGGIQAVWVEQDDERPSAFEVVHAALSATLERSQPERFGSLGLPSFRPSTTTGLATVWHAGSVRSGQLYFSPGPVEPRRIVPGLLGGQTMLAEDEMENFHLVFVDTGDPPGLRYAWKRATEP